MAPPGQRHQNAARSPGCTIAERPAPPVSFPPVQIDGASGALGEAWASTKGVTALACSQGEGAHGLCARSLAQHTPSPVCSGESHGEDTHSSAEKRETHMGGVGP